MPDYLEIVKNGAMALLMGLLVGLEREYSQKGEEPLFAGIRTFPLITFIGFLSALVARAGYPWVLPVALGGVCAIIVTAYFLTARYPNVGATTEIVGILAFIFGALAAFGYLFAAATFAIVSTLVLSMKDPLHQLAATIQKDEIYAILKFGIVTVTILPLLPNRAFGPFAVLNPYKIWLMVVLISAVSMLGYILMRFMGARHGIALTGFLGGLASSTAVTLGLSQKAREAERSVARYFALGIVIACTTMFFRVFIVSIVIDQALGLSLALPIAIPALVGVALGLFLWKKKGGQAETKLETKNPMELGRAVKFALAFGVVLLIAKASYSYLGSTGLYIASALAGLTDVDAITVSSATLARDKVLATNTAGAAILLAGAANTMVKGGMAAVVGGPTFRPVILPVMVALVLGSLAGCIWLAIFQAP